MNKDEFEEIIRKYMKKSYFTALGMVGNEADAMDLSQDAFVLAYRARKNFLHTELQL